MHAESMERWTHEHVFLGRDHARNERRTQIVIGLCGIMIIAEIVGGILFGSMALVADGLHMSTHAAALLIAALAYTFARRRVHDARYTFGTGKFGDIAGFTSAIVLAMIAMLIGWESIGRLKTKGESPQARWLAVAKTGKIQRGSRAKRPPTPVNPSLSGAPFDRRRRASFP